MNHEYRELEVLKIGPKRSAKCNNIIKVNLLYNLDLTFTIRIMPWRLISVKHKCSEVGEHAYVLLVSCRDGNAILSHDDITSVIFFSYCDCP